MSPHLEYAQGIPGRQDGSASGVLDALQLLRDSAAELLSRHIEAEGHQPFELQHDRPLECRSRSPRAWSPGSGCRSCGAPRCASPTPPPDLIASLP